MRITAKRGAHVQVGGQSHYSLDGKLSANNTTGAEAACRPADLLAIDVEAIVE